MAKVALMTETLSPLALNLASALEQQKQEVVLITSRSEIEKAPSKIRVLAPFKRWSSFEALRAAPALLGENFDVWHFLFPTTDARPRTAHWMLAALARGIPGKVIAGSFSNIQNVAGWKNEKFIGLLDLALFPNRSFLMQMKRRHTFGSHTLAEVLPPLDWMPSTSTPRFRDETQRLLSGLRPFLILPDLQSGPKWLSQSPVDFVVLRAPPRRGSSHPHVFYTGELYPAEREAFMKRAKALCLLYGDYSVLELQLFHQWSEKHQIPVIANKHQTELWPGLCWHTKSGWVLEESGDPLRDLLVQNPSLQLERGFENYPHRELVDSTLNELLRLYQKSFALRWT